MRDPDWPAMLAACPSCAYNLNGLTPPINCPECGFAVDDKSLILHGVVKIDSSQSSIRRALWILVIVFGVILLYGWVGLIFMGWYGLIVFLLWLGGFITLIATSKRDRSGRSAIVFTAGGFIAVADLNDSRQEGQAITWKQVSGLRLDRVSPVWYRLQIWSPSAKLLDAGVRCPDEDAKLVYDTLEAYRTGQSSSAVMR